MASTIKKPNRKYFLIPNIVYVLIAGLVVRLIFSIFGTLRLDHGTFIAWGRILANSGFHNFYNGWSDYLPGYLYVLWLLGKIYDFLPIDLLYKLPAIFADLITGFMIFKIVRNIKSNEKLALIASSIYIFNPAIFANSAMWGQVDSITALFSVLSIYILPYNFYLSAIFLSIGTLVKPQAAFIFPLILFLFIKNKKSIFDVLAYCLVGFLIFIMAFIPFWNHGTLFSFIYERLSVSANQYTYTSVNAFNFWGLFGFWKMDNLFAQIGGYLFVIFLTAVVFIRDIKTKQKNSQWFLASLIFATTFIFFTRMHERHMLPLFAPLAISTTLMPVLIIPYIGFSVVYILNLYYSYNWITYNFFTSFPEIIIKFIIIISIASLGLLIWFITTKKKYNLDLLVLMNRFISSVKSQGVGVGNKFPEITINKKLLNILLYTVLVFSFTVRVFNLGYPPSEYFDEVYHAFTAKTMLNPVEAHKAWEWWNTPPEGFAYEWTHPPLAKLGMAMGMLIFGQNSFGYRIPGALLGTICVFLIYLIAKEIFKDKFTAILSAAVFSLDGLALVMSRIGMNDSYLLVSVLAATYFFLKNKNFGSALFFAFAISSKWSAVWVLPIFFLIWLKRERKFQLSLIWFFILPFAIYLLTYFQMFTTGHGLDIWWGMQKQMWWYHTGLEADHPYTSSWWSWPLLIRPIYLYTSNEVGGIVSRIYAMGNPLVFWFGIVSVISSFIYAFVEKNKRLGLVIFSYLIFFVPWAASPRIMFLYHYLPAIPFMSIIVGYTLRRNPKLILGYFVITFLVYLYFYPHWTGLSIPLWLDKSYYWVSSWR